MFLAASQILVSTPALRPGDRLKRLTGHNLVGEDLHQLLAVAAVIACYSNLGGSTPQCF
jgi:hypothetical protein